jgi:hypothetical protein
MPMSGEGLDTVELHAQITTTGPNANSDCASRNDRAMIDLQLANVPSLYLRPIEAARLSER